MPADPKVRDLTAIVERFLYVPFLWSFHITDRSKLQIIDRRCGNFFAIFNTKLCIIGSTIDPYSSDVAHKYNRRVYKEDLA